MGNLSENNSNLKTLFAHNYMISCLIILKFCTEHGSVTAMPCAKLQNDYTAEMYDTDKFDFEKFKFTTSFRRISDIL